jgi:DNA polymerase-1
MAVKKLAIIDGKSVFYRGYYAMPNLATADGKPTGGVFGFATMALEVIKRLKPDYVAVAWDKPKTNIRKRLKLYPEYKAGRKPAPADFYDQVNILLELLKAFGWPLYELDDYEADDIMGSLALQASKKGIETMLITSDLDMLQLVDPKIHVYALKRGLSEVELYSPKSFEAKYGISVSQFLDLKALKGDSSDNVPGVPGIGEKTAIELLKAYGTIDNIYENIELISPQSLRNKLIAGKDKAYLSKQLCAIWTDAPVKLNLEAMDINRADAGEVAAMLAKLQFRSLLRQLPETLIAKIAASRSEYSNSHILPGKYLLIDTLTKLKNVVIEGQEQVYITSRAAKPHGVEPKVIVISCDGQDTYVLDVAKLPLEDLKRFLSDLPPLIGYDLKSTLELMLNLGIDRLPPVKHDILIAAFVLSSLRRDQNLTEMARTDLNYEGSSLDDLDDEELTINTPVIISTIRSLYELQKQKLSSVKAFPWLVRHVEWPLIPVLARMEVAGIELDTGYLKIFGEQIDDMLSDVEQQIYGYADTEFNIASPSQLADILFSKLKLSTNGIKKGKNGYSTAITELAKLIDLHPIIELIIRYREIAKLKSTYVDTLPHQVDEHNRVHTTFNITIAQTGRLSSTDPNLQNIPIRTELGRKIRTAFIAGEGKKLISADYSQFELRLAAVLANDQGMIEMFNRGADIHLMTAAEIYGRSPDEVTASMRSAAKAINFGILYGMSPHGLSVATGMSREAAANFIDRYKSLRKPLFKYMDEVLIRAREQGYVETLFGRRRPMPDIHSSNFAVRTAAERAAINMPIQGTEADLMKLAMIKCEDHLRSQHNHCRQLLQIHDSILVECPWEIAERLAKELQDIMQNVYDLPVRLDVDVKIGDNWGQL